MDTKHEYIEFTIKHESKFDGMKFVYDLIANAKNSRKPQTDEYWLTIFPEYALKHFYFLNGDAKPSFPSPQSLLSKALAQQGTLRLNEIANMKSYA